MKIKLGIFGSAGGALDARGPLDELIEALKEVRNECTFISGACSGYPDLVIQAMFQAGAETWGYSPATSPSNHEELFPQVSLKSYSKVIFTPENYRALFGLTDDFPHSMDHAVRFKYRNVLSTATCDAGIIISGRWGTLNEFTNLHDMGKTIGVLLGTGGIADRLATLASEISKPTGATLLFESDANRLVRRVLEAVRSSK